MYLIDDMGNRYDLSRLGRETLQEVCAACEWRYTQHAMNLEAKADGLGVTSIEARRLREQALACRQFSNMLRGGDPFARPEVVIHPEPHGPEVTL